LPTKLFGIDLEHVLEGIAYGHLVHLAMFGKGFQLLEVFFNRFMRGFNVEHSGDDLLTTQVRESMEIEQCKEPGLLRVPHAG
jgi:hypothetical protein